MAMRETVAEADWKILRQLEPIALDRFCQRAFSAETAQSVQGLLELWQR